MSKIPQNSHILPTLYNPPVYRDAHSSGAHAFPLVSRGKWEESAKEEEDEGDVLGRACERPRRAKRCRSEWGPLCRPWRARCPPGPQKEGRECAAAGNTKPGHAEIMRPGSVGGKQNGGALVILQHLMLRSLNKSPVWNSASPPRGGASAGGPVI